jgi:hypothetical protein
MSMTWEEIADRLAVLKREDWPRLSVAAITEERAPWPEIRADAAKTAIVNRYLRHWVPGNCPCCGYGIFSWGLVHGAGSCSCGWPGRLYHFVTDGDVEIVRFDAVLWAHPYEVSLTTRRRAHAR